VSLERLLAITPPSLAGPVHVDWADVEGQLGTSLPSDYKALVEAYGAATFDDFVTVFVPDHSLEGLNLLDRGVWMLWAAWEMRRYAAPDEIPYELSVGFDGELLPWGSTHNGDACYWVRRSDDPNQWTIAVNESRGPDWYEYDGGLVDFLEGTLSGRVVCDIFVEDYPMSPHACTQHPDGSTDEGSAPTWAEIRSLAGEVFEALREAFPTFFSTSSNLGFLRRSYGLHAALSVGPLQWRSPEVLEIGLNTVGNPSNGFALDIDCGLSDQSGDLLFAATRVPGLPHQRAHRRATAQAVALARETMLSRVDEMIVLVRSLERPAAGGV
jgi:hypothetical protein